MIYRELVCVLEQDAIGIYFNTRLVAREAGPQGDLAVWPSWTDGNFTSLVGPLWRQSFNVEVDDILWRKGGGYPVHNIGCVATYGFVFAFPVRRRCDPYLGGVRH